MNAVIDTKYYQDVFNVFIAVTLKVSVQMQHFRYSVILIEFIAKTHFARICIAWQ